MVTMGIRLFVCGIEEYPLFRPKLVEIDNAGVKCVCCTDANYSQDVKENLLRRVVASTRAAYRNPHPPDRSAPLLD